jgi:hypothetical protein
MKTIVKLIASFMVIASFVIACGPKSENSEAAAADSVETVAPADELPSDSTQVVDSTAVH